MTRYTWVLVVARNALRAYIVHGIEWVPVPDQKTVQMVWHDYICIKADVWPETGRPQPLILNYPSPGTQVNPAALYSSKDLTSGPRT